MKQWGIKMNWEDILKARTIAEELENEIKDWWVDEIESLLESNTDSEEAWLDTQRRAKNIANNIMPYDEQYMDDFNSWWKDGEIVEEQWQESISSELGKIVEPLFRQFLGDTYTESYISSEWEDREKESQRDARTQAGEMGYHNYEDGTWYGD